MTLAHCMTKICLHTSIYRRVIIRPVPTRNIIKTHLSVFVCRPWLLIVQIYSAASHSLPAIYLRINSRSNQLLSRMCRVIHAFCGNLVHFSCWCVSAPFAAATARTQDDEQQKAPAGQLIFERQHRRTTAKQRQFEAVECCTK